MFTAGRSSNSGSPEALLSATLMSALSVLLLPNSARAQYQAHTCILDIFTMHGNKSCIVVWSTTQPPWPLSTQSPPDLRSQYLPPPLPLCMQPIASLLPPSCPIDASVNVSQKLPICAKFRILSRRLKNCNLVVSRSYNLILNPRQHLKAWAVFKGQGYNPLTGILDHKIMQS